MNMKPRKREAEKETSIVLCMMKSLLYAYLVTGILLLVLAALLYKFDLGQSKVSIGIIIIYIIANFIGGFSIGKTMKQKKYIWGMLLGILYVAVLFIITLGVYRALNDENIVTTLILCICSGTIGGMLS